MAIHKKNTGLGRGLNAIFDTEDIIVKKSSPNQDIERNVPKSGEIAQVALTEIEANSAQPRKNFDDELLGELADSIKTLGIIQPITLRERDGGKYTIISGERRFRASKIAGLTHLPAYIRKVDDSTMLEMALVENIQREELSSMEIAFTLSRLIDECGVTQEELATKIGKKRSTVSNYIRLLKLPAAVQLSLSENIISMGHAKAIMSIEDEDSQIELLKKIVKQHLSVRQAESLAKAINEASSNTTSKDDVEIEYPESYSRLVEHLEGFFNQEISIKKNTKGVGKIIIGFDGDSEIEDIISKFERLNKI